ncbi:MAG TPA: hypothetical protein VGH67_11145 [Solirubrobacteraceae bacterium]
MAENPRLIIQIPADGAVDRQFHDDPPASLAGPDVVVERGPTDQEGVLEPPVAGQVVLSLPSPEALRRDPGTVREVIDTAGTSTEPIVVVIEAAEALREDELAVIRAAADRAPRPVILRVIRDA